jgi:hypothetical protein
MLFQILNESHAYFYLKMDKMKIRSFKDSFHSFSHGENLGNNFLNMNAIG